jgi:hypothetical protein
MSEDSLQAMCEQYLDLLGLRWVHIPRGALTICSWQSSAHVAAKRAVSDYLKGIPDLLIFGPYTGGKYTQALLVELKIGKNTRTHAQKEWARLTNVHEVRDFDTFKGLVDGFVETTSTEEGKR